MVQSADRADSLARARREHAYADLRQDDSATRLLQRAIATLEALDEPADERIAASYSAVVTRLQARLPDMPHEQVVHAVRESAVAVAVATMRMPTPERVEVEALARLLV